MKTIGKLLINAAILVLIPWIVFCAVDAVEEFVLDTSMTLATLGLMLLISLISVFLYLFLYIKNPSEEKYTAKHLIMWYAIYFGLYLLISVPICYLIDGNNWIIPQKMRSAYLDLNGVEYFFFAIGQGVWMFSTIFYHIGAMIQRAAKKHRKDKNRA